MCSEPQHIVWIEETKSLQLVTASGEQLHIVEHIRAPVQLGELQLTHEFVVVDRLVAPVILIVDFFLHDSGLVLDLT